jgi:hypothetical protein
MREMKGEKASYSLLIVAFEFWLWYQDVRYLTVDLVDGRRFYGLMTDRLQEKQTSNSRTYSPLRFARGLASRRETTSFKVANIVCFEVLVLCRLFSSFSSTTSNSLYYENPVQEE